MAMGVQPGPVKCPKGMYRPPGGGTSLGECRFCPRGVYGDSPGLLSSDCTAKCPKGTYQDKIGAKSIVDCKPCPAGVYGSAPGLTSSACTAPCPLGKYSMKIGLQTQSECDDCAVNYRGPQGRRGNNLLLGYEGGFPCDRYTDGKTVLNGRTVNNDAKRDAFYASTRVPHNDIVDNS
jgi:hypothetical protein